MPDHRPDDIPDDTSAARAVGDGSIRVAAVLGSGTMGAQIALSLALGGLDVRLWGRREGGLIEAHGRIDEALDFLIAQGLARQEDRKATLGRIRTEPDLAHAVGGARGAGSGDAGPGDAGPGGARAGDADSSGAEAGGARLGGAGFVIEAVAEDLDVKRELLARAEAVASPDAILSSTTSALSPTDIARDLADPSRFCVAHYAQPAHLVELVEVVPSERTGEATVEAVTALLTRTGKAAVRCPDVPGFLWVRIQHAVLREFASLVGRGLVTPEACDTVLRRGYAARLPAMGAFEHADLAGLDLLNGDAAKAVWADLSNASDPAATPVGQLFAEGHTGMRSGRGFYDWRTRDADAFRRARDEEIVRRVKIARGGRVVLGDNGHDGHDGEGPPED